MAWVKLDDSFFRNTKVVGISAESRLIYLAGLCYASASLSDGFIPKGAVKILAAEAGVSAGPKRIRELVDAGLWVENPDGYSIHDYLEHNSSADDVRTKREQARTRMQRKRSHDVRANTERTSPEIREPDTDTDTDSPSGDGEREGADAPTPPVPPATKTRGTRLPDDFAVTDDMRDWARSKGATDELIDRETEKFREWWPAQPGAKGVKVDWVLTWKTWIRRQLEQAGPPGSSPVRHLYGSRADRKGNAFDEVRRELGYAPGPDHDGAIDTTFRRTS